MAGQTIQVSVLADTKKFSRAMRGLSSELGLDKVGRAASGLGKAVAIGAGVAGVAAVGLGGKVVGLASSLQQSVGAVDSIFKDNADTIHKWATGAATSVGLSRDSYNGLASLIGAQLKNGGTAMDQLAGKTDGLIKVGADLSAQFGGSTQQAVEALSSALKGERDPIEKYGVSLNQARIDAKAAELGFEKVGGTLSAEANQAATLALIMEQTADAHGAFGREANTLAGQQERLKAKLQNIGATLGTYLLPIITTVVAWVSERLGPAFESLAGWIEGTAVPALQRLGEWLQANVLPVLQQLGEFILTRVVPALQQLGAWIGGTLVPALVSFGTWVRNNAAWLVPLVIVLGTAAVVIGVVAKAIAVWSAITKAAAAAQAILNASLLANPIILIVALIVGLVAAVVYLWKTNEGFRAAVLRVWDAIKSGIGSAVAWVKARIEQLGQVPGQVTGWFNRAKASAIAALTSLVSWVSGLPGRIFSALGQLGSYLLRAATIGFDLFRTGVSNGVDSALAFVRGIPDRILSALGSLGSLLSGAGRSVIDGFLNGITGAFDRVRDTLGNLTSMLPDWKGPAPRDRTILQGAGRLVIEGFTRGLRSRVSGVKRELTALTRMVATTPMPAIPAPSGGLWAEPVPGPGSASRYARGTTVVQVNALVPTPETGRMVAEALAEHDRRNGAGR